MFVRLALESDADRVVDMAAAALAETLPNEPVDRARIRATFGQYIATAESTVFVVESKRQVIAFLQAGIGGYDYRAGFFTTQRVIYVLPEKRGTRAAALLMQEFIRWSRQIGAAEALGGNHNGFRSSRMTTFLARFGFADVGRVMTYRIEA